MPDARISLSPTDRQILLLALSTHVGSLLQELTQRPGDGVLRSAVDRTRALAERIEALHERTPTRDRDQGYER